ncbi:MAG: hypothetical protein V4543_01130 [Bacteroidota bacterium]
MLLLLTVVVFVSGMVSCSKTQSRQLQPGSASLSAKSLPYTIENISSFDTFFRPMADSLIKYSDSLHYLNSDLEFPAIIQTVGDIKTALLTNDTILYRYELVNKTWKFKDSLGPYASASSAKSTDLNDDGFDDLLVFSHPNVNGLSFTEVFMGNSSGTLKYRPDYGHVNLFKVENKRGILGSWFWGGTYAPQGKEYYTWVGDSLQLLRGAEMVLVPDTNKENTVNPVVSLYRLKNRKKFIYRQCLCPEVFDTAIWKGSPLPGEE